MRSTAWTCLLAALLGSQTARWLPVPQDPAPAAAPSPDHLVVRSLEVRDEGGRTRILLTGEGGGRLELSRGDDGRRQGPAVTLGPVGEDGLELALRGIGASIRFGLESGSAHPYVRVRGNGLAEELALEVDEEGEELVLRSTSRTGATRTHRLPPDPDERK